MPKLTCSYGRFVEIIENHGFSKVRQRGTSHGQWRRETAEAVYIVTVAGHGNTMIPIGTLKAMIRQSGLPASLFKR